MANNIEINFVPLTKEDRASIARELLTDNITQKELAEKYNISDFTLRNWVKKYLTEEEKLQIIRKREDAATKIRTAVLTDVLDCTLSRKEISKKHDVSEDLIGQWVRKYLTKEQKELIKSKKNAPVVVERDNLAKIRRCEKEYSRIDTGAHISPKNDKIRKFYIETLKIGNGLELDKYDAQAEFIKLIEFISTDKFYKEYGREYTIVDMYLTTNLQIKDLFDPKYDFLDKEVSQLIYEFVKNQLVNIENTYLRDCNVTNKRHLVCRFMRPVDNEMKDIIDRRFFLFKKMSANETDVLRAYETLKDLNQKYGVKYDDISLYIILREIINENIDSFYELGEKYKSELDMKSHVQIRCIPLLTRREKNE
jgi:transposase-like protein